MEEPAEIKMTFCMKCTGVGCHDARQCANPGHECRKKYCFIECTKCSGTGQVPKKPRKKAA